MIVTRKAARVLSAGTGINLVIGVLYAWGVFKEFLVQKWSWTNSEASLPYTAGIVCFSLSLFFSGFLQDIFGPKKIVVCGIFLAGLGMLLSGFVYSPFLLFLTFGVVSGSGIGMTYACMMPTVMKWFHPCKKGQVTGITVSGFGFSAVYMAPLISSLASSFGISTSFIIIGLIIWIVGLSLSGAICNPSPQYTPATPAISHRAVRRRVSVSPDFSVSEMLKTPQFHSLWIMFMFSSSAGLMIIGNIVSIAATQAQLTNAAFLISVLAAFNSIGRLLAGILSDKIGRIETMLIIFFIQALNMLFFRSYDSIVLLSLGAVMTGICYGALFGVFPSTIADYFGLKNYGVNYGVFNTAWGLSGLIGPVISAWVSDKYSYYDSAYIISAVLLAVAFICALVTQPVRKHVKQPDQGRYNKSHMAGTISD